MKVGLIGLEFAGKKSLFSLLTGKEETLGQQQKEEIATVNVPDERIDFLAQLNESKKKVYSQIEFHLIQSLKKSASDKSNPLVETKDIDIFAIVIRQFADENVFHPLGPVDINRDYNVVKEELIFADLFLIETRLERIEKQLKSEKIDYLVREAEILKYFKDNLENGRFINELELDDEKNKLINSLKFLTYKPIFIIINCDEDKIKTKFQLPGKIDSLNISVKIEKEIQQLDENARKEFLGSLGLENSCLDRMIKFSYGYADLISFLTTGEKESHSWTIKKGTTAQAAAGAIHSDFEKGFIRAEVVSYEELKEAGSEQEAKKKGLYRLEGKEYIVKDGDVILFRFNV